MKQITITPALQVKWSVPNETKSPAKNLQISSCSIATLSHVCNYKVQFCAFKSDAQNLPLRRVGRGEISPP